MGECKSLLVFHWLERMLYNWQKRMVYHWNTAGKRKWYTNGRKDVMPLVGEDGVPVGRRGRCWERMKYHW
jgi:hypothetical protein